MASSDRINAIRQKIENDIDMAGGVEGFNDKSYAHETITHWIGMILDAIESEEK